MYSILVEVFIAVIIVENITQILVKSELLKPVRGFFFEHREIKIFSFIHDLLDCGYCTSFWVSVFVCTIMMYVGSCINDWLGLFILCIVIHRLSNIFHYIIDLLGNFSHKY